MELKPMATLPETGFLRLPQIVGDPKAYPPTPALIPVSRSTWWAGVKSRPIPTTGQTRPAHHRLAGGRYPPPHPGHQPCEVHRWNGSK